MSNASSGYKWLVTFGGAGYSPIAPGTVGTLAALFIVWLITFVTPTFGFQQILLGLLIVISYVAGVAGISKVSEEWGSDPSRVVIDEACGLWISLLFLPLTVSNLLLAFIFFRFFDIAKPLGIRKLDQMKSLRSHGVMLDDVLAGLYSCLIIHVIQYAI